MDPSSHEVLLMRELLDGYEMRSTAVRPLLNSSDKVVVKFGMRLITMDIDEAEQTMKVSAWLRIVSARTARCYLHNAMHARCSKLYIT
jgi:hypothetical protein